MPDPGVSTNLDVSPSFPDVERDPLGPSDSGEWRGRLACAIWVAICVVAPCDMVRFSTRDVRYSFWRSRACSEGEVVVDGGTDSLGVCGLELTLGTGLRCREDWPLLTIEPFRDMCGELEPLASTHSSSGSSMPMSNVTWDLLDFCLFTEVLLALRCSLSEDRMRLDTSMLERLRLRLDWEALLGRIGEELSRDNLASLLTRRWFERRLDSRSPGDVVRLVSLGAG